MRRVYVTIPAFALANMLREHKNYFHYTRVKHGIPADAKLIRSGYIANGNDPTSDGDFFLTFEHESFPEIKEGNISEPFVVTFQTIQTADEF
jgi:hypothetical protein